MTIRINIPFKSIEKIDPPSLDLSNPARCSRCNAQPASSFETHPLKYQGGYLRSHAFSKDFEKSVTFQLRLPLCSDCYQKNFIEAPETMTRDQGPLGSAARLRSAGVIAGSLVACTAFILLMKVIPLPKNLARIEYLWLYLVAISAAILALTYGLSAIKYNHSRQMLKNGNSVIQLHRAAVLAKIQYEKPAADDVAVVIELNNDAWAEECAEFYGWTYQIVETQSKKDKEK
jgi:hypothetical protein